MKERIEVFSGSNEYTELRCTGLEEWVGLKRDGSKEFKFMNQRKLGFQESKR